MSKFTKMSDGRFLYEVSDEELTGLIDYYSQDTRDQIAAEAIRFYLQQRQLDRRYGMAKT